MSGPERIQLRRTKGWRMPANTVKVDRTTKWGNPFRVGDVVHRGPGYSGRDEVVRDSYHAVELFRAWLFHQQRSANMAPELRGKNLACWCPLDAPCHADVLLELSNDLSAKVAGEKPGGCAMVYPVRSILWVPGDCGVWE